MLPAAYRFPLRSHPDFFLLSQRLQTENLVAYVRKNDSTRLRCSVVVPKKVATLSVERSRLKRLLTTRVGMIFSLQTPVDLVVRVKRRLPLDHQYEFIIADLQILANQINSRLSNPTNISR